MLLRSDISQQDVAAHRREDAGPYGAVAILFGLIWVLNAGFQFYAWIGQPGHQGSANFLEVLAASARQAPAWLRPVISGALVAVHTVGPHWIALGMVGLALALGAAFITRFALPLACGLGISYSLICWAVLCALGYPYVHGQTDPGVFPAYLIAFLFILSLLPVLSRRPPDTPLPVQPDAAMWTAARLLFGLLWAFDAALKWMPYFQTHFLAQLTPATQGQPAWIAAYIGFVIAVVKAVGPRLMAIGTGLVETALAVSLLTGRWLRLSVPLGFLYSLAVWTTAEGWGGPYTSAGTGIRGNVVGNVLIYAVIFLILMVPVVRRTAEERPR